MESSSIDKAARQLEQYRGQQNYKEKNHGVEPVSGSASVDMGGKENNWSENKQEVERESAESLDKQPSDLEPHLGKNIDLFA